jgi:hypothetical protein
MATGRLGASALTASTNATVYEVPADTFSVVTVNITNRNAADRQIRLALASADTPDNSEYLEYDTTLLGNGVLEKSGVVMDAGKKIVAYANGTEVNVVIYGIETATA